MPFPKALFSCALALSLGCAGAAGRGARAGERALSRPATRAERSGYRETSTYDDVVRFLDSLQALEPGAFARASLGASTQGRDVPLVMLHPTAP